MGHAVCYRDATGATQVEDVASLDAALEQVERLRNDDGVTDVRVFREVQIEVRTYYKAVALDGGDGEPAAAPAAAAPNRRGGQVEPPPGAMPIAPPVTSRREAPAPAAEESDDAKDSADGRRTTLFTRG
jgi:hypothetical protein